MILSNTKLYYVTSNYLITTMHSRRMRTGRSLTVCCSLLPRGVVSAPGGCLFLGGGVCFWGVGGVCSWGVSAFGGCLLLGVCWGVSAPGGVCSGGVSAPRGCAPGGVCSRGVSAPLNAKFPLISLFLTFFLFWPQNITFILLPLFI